MVTFASVVLWASLGTSAVVDPLHQAARANDVERIQRLLAGRLLGLLPGFAADELNATGFGVNEHRTPLMAAAEAGSAEAITELLARGADPSVLLYDPELGQTSAWCLALMGRHQRQTTWALARGSGLKHLPRPEAICADGAMLIAAAREGRGDTLAFRLRGSPSQEALKYALNETVGKRQLDLPRVELIARIVDLHDLKAVQTALVSGDPLVLSQLAAAGATVSAEAALGNLSTQPNDHTRAELLTQLLKMTKLTTGQVARLSQEALNDDSLETLEVLAPLGVRLDADPDWPHSDQTALSLALLSRDPPRAVQALLRLGVQLATPAALSRVVAQGNCQVAKVLTDWGARLDQVDQNCQTPAEVASEHGQWRLVQLLGRAVKGYPRLANPAVSCADTVDHQPREPPELFCNED